MSAPEASTDPSSGSETPPAPALQRLLEVERRAERELARARAEAGALVEAARRRTLEEEAAAQRDLAGAAARLEREVRTRLDEHREAVEAEADAAARRYEATPDRVEKLAGIVVDELLSASWLERS